MAPPVVVGHGFQSVFTGGVAPVFRFFTRADDDGVKQCVWSARLSLRAASKSDRLVVSPASVTRMMTRRRSSPRRPSAA